MITVGLTGNIGSGKSSVARLLKQLGAEVIDADALARQATSETAVLKQIETAFGPAVIKDGQLDRPAMAQIVFSDPAKRQTLNSIIHPWVRREAARLAASCRAAGASVLVQDIPLLFESGLQADFDSVVVVTAPLDLRVQRVMQRSGLAAEEVRRRDAAQLPLEEKAARADFTVDNSGSEEDLLEQVKKLWAELHKQSRPEDGV